MSMFINFLYQSVLSGTPLLFGTVGEIATEKSGNLNLGVEGMMAVGAISGLYFGYISNSLLLAILAAFIAGALTALIYAVLTITFKANQNVSGLTLSIFGIGLAYFLGDFLRTKVDNPSLTLPPEFKAKIAAIDIPYLSDIPYIGKLFFQYNPFVYLAILIAIAVGVYLNHTRIGLNLRAVGENPAAADAAGISVTKVRYINTLLGGGIAGIGGSYISIVLCGYWTADCINGLGWVAVALVIFASWNPFRAILGSFIFGLFKNIRVYIPRDIIDIPTEFNAIFDMLPYLVTAIILVITSIRQSKENTRPEGVGLNYFREER